MNSPSRPDPRPRFALGLALTALAGALDAVSFLHFGSVYASFMSGNTVQLGLHAAGPDPGPLAAFAALIGLFVLGALVGSLAVARLGAWHLAAILALETVAIAVAFGLDRAAAGATATALPLSFAMGAQNNLVVLLRGANAGTTFVTGTAFRFADAVAQRLLGRDPDAAWRFHLAVWAAFAAGAAAGALGEIRLGSAILLPLAALPALLAAGTAVVVARRR